MGVEIIKSIIGVGGALGGAAIASKAQSAAAQTQADAIQKGVDLEEKMYQQDRADLEPYRAIGAGGLSQLGYLAGIPSAAPAAAPASSLSSLGTAVPRPASTPAPRSPAQAAAQAQAAQGGSPMVSVRSPNGHVGQIPATMLPQALAAGGTQV